MKKTLLSLLLLAGCFLTAISQKVINDVNAEKRSASGFHAVEISDGIDLFISQGDESVAVSANTTKIRDRIKVEVVNGVLKIQLDRTNHLNMEWGNHKMVAYVSFKNLDHLS